MRVEQIEAFVEVRGRAAPARDAPRGVHPCASQSGASGHPPSASSRHSRTLLPRPPLFSTLIDILLLKCVSRFENFIMFYSVVDNYDK